ncbi:fasciclin domain-containing protein [Pseudonocardia petroleophila]|uniref:Fasciclin domain-containing protein n=1 Tax=Pseudonocardia petroleophila TaxID=37331 RepID=A0A7G7MIZ0_9PSEU|nr:fasciclin domain-containing protein [Pseudonocardia petroleophila]QNG52751.1 fasciclin domain-containing protein [Pseudonocardia petroleophila]
MKHLPRLAAVGATAALTIALSGCGNSEEPAADPTTPVPSSSPSATPTTGADEQGVTAISDIYGPACAQVPAEGEGSAEGMVDDPVATAAGNNPLLGTLAQAVEAAGLVDTLNDPEASYTVFAPADAAFEALPAGTLDALLADPQGRLTEILTYHVVPERYDAEGLAEAGTVTTVQGDQLVVSGEATDLVIDEQEQAAVLCGNIPTANATVFVIDKVLMPPAP